MVESCVAGTLSGELSALSGKALMILSTSLILASFPDTMPFSTLTF
jgi:hypothetical protein